MQPHCSSHVSIPVRLLIHKRGRLGRLRHAEILTFVSSVVMSPASSHSTHTFITLTDIGQRYKTFVTRSLVMFLVRRIVIQAHTHRCRLTLQCPHINVLRRDVHCRNSGCLRVVIICFVWSGRCGCLFTIQLRLLAMPVLHNRHRRLIIIAIAGVSESRSSFRRRTHILMTWRMNPPEPDAFIIGCVRPGSTW